MTQLNAVQNEQDRQKVTGTRTQYSTFLVENRLYGIDVTKVQEVVRPMALTPIPLAQKYIHGLVNLRGQVVTAVSLHDLFGLPGRKPTELMNVICKFDGALISLMVDEIGDVVEVDTKHFDRAPNNISESTRKFMTKIYLVGNQLLSVLDVDKIYSVLNESH
jgi:purine-binding chemotaxis protein CheW